MKSMAHSLRVFVTMLSFLLAVTAVGCQNKQIKASDKYISKEIKSTGFNALKVSGSPQVEYTVSKDGSSKITVYAPDNVMEYLDVRVEHNTLVVKYDRMINIVFNNKNKVRVVASSPTIKAAILDGSGDIILKNNITTDEMALKLNGSGDIRTEDIVVSGSFKAELNGSGDIKMNGSIKAETVEIRLRGSGDVDAKNGVLATSGIVQLEGSGDIKLEGAVQMEKIEVALRGSGDLLVKGIDTHSVKASLHGSGDVELWGKSQYAMLSLRSSGDIKASKLQAGTVQASLSGSGSINCYAADKLIGEVNGSGGIYYKGNPAVEDKSPRKSRIRKG